MLVDSDNCTMPFVWQFLEGILIHDGNIAYNCQKKSSFFVLCTIIVTALQVCYWQTLNMLHIKIFRIYFSIYWYKVYTNNMICSAVRDKNITPPPKFVKPRVFGDFK
jgi:hypothetical protein